MASNTTSTSGLARLCGDHATICHIHLFVNFPIYTLFILLAALRLKSLFALPKSPPRALAKAQLLRLALASALATYALVFFAIVLTHSSSAPYQWIAYPFQTLAWLVCVALLLAEARYGLAANWVFKSFAAASFLAAIVQLVAILTSPPALHSAHTPPFIAHLLLFAATAAAALFARDDAPRYAPLPFDIADVTFDDADDRAATPPPSSASAAATPWRSDVSQPRFTAVEGIALRRLFLAVRDESAFVIFGLLALLAAAPLEAIQFVYLGLILDAAAAQQTDAVGDDVSLLVALYLAEALLTTIHLLLIARAAARVATRLRAALFSSAVRQDVTFLDGAKTATIGALLEGEVEAVREALVAHAALFVSSAAQVLIAVALLFVISWQLSLIALALSPLAALVMFAQATAIHSFSRHAADAQARADDVLRDVVANVDAIRSFARENREKSRYSNETVAAYGAAKKLAFVVALTEGGGVFLIKLCAVLALYFGAQLSLSSQITPGAAVAFAFVLLFAAMAAATLPSALAGVGGGVAAVRRIFEIVERESATNLVGGLTLPRAEGAVEFKDVTFRYPLHPQRDALSRVTFRVGAGERVVIFGGAGSGKTTLLWAAARVVDALMGSVMLDGTDVGTFDASWFR
jgi:ABC-type transport system involved in cytochrome bd biosynthesis fused ATPase/permease subunit